MRRIANSLRLFPLSLVLLACAAIAGCSASGRVRVDNHDHDANHFNSNSGADHDRQPYAPRSGQDYLSLRSFTHSLQDAWK